MLRQTNDFCVWMAKNEWAGALESSNAAGEKSEESELG
jgi:hypothetical protein